MRTARLCEIPFPEALGNPRLQPRFAFLLLKIISYNQTYFLPSQVDYKDDVAVTTVLAKTRLATESTKPFKSATIST